MAGTGKTAHIVKRESLRTRSLRGVKERGAILRLGDANIGHP
jgi:hypothetical protein